MTSRPAYWPQFGQIACGRRGCLQFGQGWIWTSASARCERRRPFFDLDSLTFGRATARKLYRNLASRRLVCGFLVGRLVGLQRLHPTSHRLQGAAEVGLELLQLLERVGLRLADDLVALRLRVLDDLRGMTLSAAQDLVLAGRLLSALVGAGHGARGLGVGLGDDPLLLGDRPVRLLDLVWQVESDLVDELHQLVLVEHDRGRERDMARVLDQILETVKQLVDLYLNFSFSALATGGGTRSDTFPP